MCVCVGGEGHKRQPTHQDKTRQDKKPKKANLNVPEKTTGRSSSSSYYKRSPRKNFISRALKKLKHLLRDLIRHAKRHPFRVFMLAIVPLVACGALTALLARFGLKLPAYVERLITTAGKAATGDSVGLVGEAVKMVGGLTGGGNKERGDSRGRGGGDDGFSFERKEEGMFSGMGGMGALSGLSGLAKVF